MKLNIISITFRMRQNLAQLGLRSPRNPLGYHSTQLSADIIASIRGPLRGKKGVKRGRGKGEGRRKEGRKGNRIRLLVVREDRCPC